MGFCEAGEVWRNLELSATNFFCSIFLSCYLLLWQQSERATVLGKISRETDFETEIRMQECSQE